LEYVRPSNSFLNLQSQLEERVKTPYASLDLSKQMHSKKLTASSSILQVERCGCPVAEKMTLKLDEHSAALGQIVAARGPLTKCLGLLFDPSVGRQMRKTERDDTVTRSSAAGPRTKFLVVVPYGTVALLLANVALSIQFLFAFSL
jgi:hypothetical protein